MLLTVAEMVGKTASAFAPQVRFSRHLLLAALQVAISAGAAAASTGVTWRGAIPVELSQAVGTALVPAAGLYFMEAAARRAFYSSRTAQRAE